MYLLRFLPFRTMKWKSTTEILFSQQHWLFILIFMIFVRGVVLTKSNLHLRIQWAALCFLPYHNDMRHCIVLCLSSLQSSCDNLQTVSQLCTRWFLCSFSRYLLVINFVHIMSAVAVFGWSIKILVWFVEIFDRFCLTIISIRIDIFLKT